MRPLYEQEEDRSAERQIADCAAQNWHVTPHKLSMAYGLDFAMCEGRTIKAFLETKHRNWVFGDGDGFRISLLKVLKAQEIEATVGIPCLMAIRFYQEIYWARFRTTFDCILAGRLDRPDALDIEPHVVVPWSDFRRL